MEKRRPIPPVDKVLKGLRNCRHVVGNCDKCPYQSEEICDTALMHDALKVIEQLLKE